MDVTPYRRSGRANSLEVALDRSTNTALHLLAAAQEAGVPFTMADIDRLSRRVPHLCKVAPSSADVHVEDVHRAGGILGILGELDRLGLIHRSAYTVHAPTLGDAIERWDVRRNLDPEVERLYRAAPGGVRTTRPFSQEARYESLDLDRKQGAVREVECAFIDTMLIHGQNLREVLECTDKAVGLRNEYGRCYRVLSPEDASSLDLNLFVGIGNRRRIRFLRVLTRRFAINAGSRTTQRLTHGQGVNIAHPLIREHKPIRTAGV